MYEYKADLIRVVDGDTIWANLHLGFGIVFKANIRLIGINAPESRTRDLVEKKKGIAATVRLNEILLNNDIIIRTTLDKKGKFGRILGDIIVHNVSVNKQMVVEGHATIYS